MKTKKQNSFGLEQQQNILDHLIKYFEKDPFPKSSQRRTIAITGSRGWGKTTILHAFRDKFAGQNNVVLTSILDASVISDEVGLFGACIEELHKTALLKLKDRNIKLDSHFENIFSKLTHTIISHQTSYQMIAEDMAMSPEHYIQLVRDWNRTGDSIVDNFNAYMEALRKLFEYDLKIVIFLDDLDLAAPKTLTKWAKNMIGWYRHCATMGIYWILTYDRRQILKTLSKCESNETEYANGNSTLNKLVFDQYDLQPLNYREKATFRPYLHGALWEDFVNTGITPNKEKDTIDELLQKSGMPSLKMALPDSPRGLTKLYFWIMKNNTSSIDPFRIIDKIAEINGHSDILTQLQQNSDRDIFKAPKEYSHWVTHIIRSIRNNEQLSMMITNKEMELSSSYIEHICNIDLLQDDATYPLIRSITQDLPFFSKSLACYPVRRPITITEFFLPESKILGASLYWSKWEFDPVSKSGYLNTGPQILWESLFLGDQHSVVSMLSALYLNSHALGFALDEQFRAAGTSHQILPRNFRALFLLVFQLSRAPWLELAVSHQFWTPISVIRCSAAFYVSAMACEIWPDLELASPLYWPCHPFSKVKQLSDRQVHEAFKLLITDLKAKSFDLEVHDPLQLAQKAMHNALTNLFQLKALTLLAEELT